MVINKKIFGEYEGNPVYSYILDNENGLYAEILTFGGIIRRLVYKGVDVVLGRDTLEEYLNNNGYFGAIIGRNSNRIENAEFELCGEKYKVFKNNGENNLHGGKCGFDKKVWDGEIIDGDEPTLILSATSPDDEEGFPGTVNVKVKYTLTKDNGIEIHYSGESDKDTVLNMTNHSYFNLNGHGGGIIDKHLLWLNSEFYTPNTVDCIPTGEVLSVKGTPFDFSFEKEIATGLNSNHSQVRMFGGFDHNFALKGRGYRKVAKITGDKSGIAMEIYTDQPGMQIYSGNGIEENRVCKDGEIYGAHQGICFETQAFPNFLQYSHFPDGILKKGEKYDTITTYKFK